MPYTLVFLISTLSERLVNIDIGPLRLSIGDVCLLFSIPYLIILNSRIQKIFCYLAIFAFLVILSSIVYNTYPFGFNSLISIPLRIIASYIIFLELQRLQTPGYWKQVIHFTIFVLIFCLLFLSDAAVYSILDIFNRNELLAYIISLFLLSNVIKTKYNQDISDRGVILHLLIILFVIFLSLLVGSRQHLLGLSIGVLFLLFLLPIRIKVLAMFVVAAISLVSLPTITQKILSNERSIARAETIIKFEPATRADQFRLNNITQAINGFQESYVFGNGPTSFRRDNKYDKVAHSTPFSVAYEFGVLGLFWLLLVLYFILRPAFSKRRLFYNRKSQILAIYLLPCVIIQALFMELLAKAPLYVFLACGMYLMYGDKRSRERNAI